MKKQINKSMFKMSSEELAVWLHYRKAASLKANKKGKGSYKRQKCFVEE